MQAFGNGEYRFRAITLRFILTRSNSTFQKSFIGQIELFNRITMFKQMTNVKLNDLTF